MCNGTNCGIVLSINFMNYVYEGGVGIFYELWRCFTPTNFKCTHAKF